MVFNRLTKLLILISIINLVVKSALLCWYTVIPRFTGPRFTVSRDITWLFVFPDVVFNNRTYVNFPLFTVPRIYRAFFLSPEKHGKSRDYCYMPRFSFMCTYWDNYCLYSTVYSAIFFIFPLVYELPLFLSFSISILLNQFIFCYNITLKLSPLIL